MTGVWTKTTHHLEQLVSDPDASVSSRRSSRMESHHKDAETGTIPVSCQAETQTLSLLLQLHAEQRPLQVSITLTPTLWSTESMSFRKVSASSQTRTKFWPVGITKEWWRSLSPEHFKWLTLTPGGGVWQYVIWRTVTVSTHSMMFYINVSCDQWERKWSKGEKQEEKDVKWRTGRKEERLRRWRREWKDKKHQEEERRPDEKDAGAEEN